MIPADAPFVLLDDARAQGAPARLYRDPVAIVTTRSGARVRGCLDQLRGAAADGFHVAGFIGYDAGAALEPKLAPIARDPAEDAPPLLWFGLFHRCEQVAEPARMLPDPRSAWTAPPRPLIARKAYEAAVERLLAHIGAGDVYQANLSFAAEVAVAGSALALYARLRDRARAGHGGIVSTGAHWLLSFSPELFFTVKGDAVTTRPMKGTAPRGADPAADAAAIETLRADPKQRAENLMIVDLIRNDLSRLARPGSVAAHSLYAVETYPTVHQLTSTVTARLEPGRGAVDLLATIFPCGSITGAPKIRAMELVDAIEARARGAYTGTIGAIAPNGDASFNVAIRTLTMKAGARTATLGLGAGIVADSRPADEWRECLAKGAFVNDSTPFDLIETMRFDPARGLVALDLHLDRLKESARALGFALDRHAARNELQAATFRLTAPSKVRLLLSPTGALAIACAPLPPTPAAPVAVGVAPLPVAADDFRLGHKTSDRGFYDEPRIRSGLFELLFADRDGFLTEGSFTNLFVSRDDMLLTPPLTRGLLPGILRAQLLAEGRALEADLTVDDLEAGVYIGNAVRGLIPATVMAGSLPAR